ncbi:pectinesterase inhibitor 10-like isoform X3 [Catharus ustulatus]|uniref:pectinesterase inhibitor 10-like isoform X3 n=1 Tax=Catharus ustulatus TaxID=91951 RepID=UPI00140E8C30|nr:pectinesterase inhibitor 10-like isoform X3 [Catharus ustulatus]
MQSCAACRWPRKSPFPGPQTGPQSPPTSSLIPQTVPTNFPSPKTALQISPQLSPGWRWSSHSSTPHPSPTQSVTAQPRRQLSSQVVSRLSSLEPPWSRSTPGWQVGVAYRDSGTPLASSMVTPQAGTSEGQGSALRLARDWRSQWDPSPRP